MNPIRIYVDINLSPEGLNKLRTQASACELLLASHEGGASETLMDRNHALQSADIAFGQPDPTAIAEAKKLKWVHISSSGITRYDNPKFRRMVADCNIMVSNSASVYIEPCATHALSFLLAQARKLPIALKTRVAAGTFVWNTLRNSSVTLRGQTIVVIGYGAIGARLAEMLKPFGMNILAYRRTPSTGEGITIVPLEQLSQALQSADHVMNILPDSEETKRFFDHSRFESIKRGAIFYNIGRGSTVDQEALTDVLRTGQLGAAWLDVTDPEPLPDNHPLWSLSNCHITPHTAGGHECESESLVSHFLNNLNLFTRGLPPRDRVM